MAAELKPAKECTVAELEAYSTPQEFSRYYYFKYGRVPTIEAVRQLLPL